VINLVKTENMILTGDMISTIQLMSNILAYLTEGSLLLLDEKPVIIPRDAILYKIISSSMPIIPTSGDWGQGKSFIGKLLYRYSLETNNFYVTYIPLANTYKQIIHEYQHLSEKFYKNVTLLEKEPMPYDAKKALSILLPLIFSPNFIKNSYNLNGILTTYPIEKDLKAEEYGDNLFSLAGKVLEKIDKKTIIILDELEEVSELLTVDKLGAILYLMRIMYDRTQNIPKVSLVLLIQETAKTNFENFLDQIRTHPAYLRAIGVVEPEIRLAPISNEEAEQYIKNLLSRLLNGYSEKLIGRDMLNNILHVVDKLSNTRLKVSLIRGFLSVIISSYIVTLKGSSALQKLQQLKEKDIIANKELVNILSDINPEDIKNVADKIKDTYVILPRTLINVLSGNYSGISKYAEKISKITADGIFENYKDKISPPALRSFAKGYKAYEVLIRSSKGTIRRIIIWTRLSRVDYKEVSREKLMKKFKLTEDEVKKVPTKILLIHTPITTSALIQELVPEYVIPILLDSATLSAILTQVEPTLLQNLPSYVFESFKKTYEENYLKKVMNIVEQLIKH
jgi:hypothetical protein